MRVKTSRWIKISSTVLIPIVVSGCCWWAKRDCFPPCSPLQKVVKIEVPCKLPPPLTLPSVSRIPCNLPNGDKMVCYDIANAGKLAKRLSDMKDWIVQARRRCSANQPSSQPVN